MPTEVNFGDLPSWLSLLVDSGALMAANIAGRRQARAADLGRQVAELVDLAEPELARLILASAALEEIVIEAVRVAADTTWTEKRRALVSVIAAAVEGDDTAVVALRLLELTITRLERPHAHALALISDQGPLVLDELRSLWPGGAEIIEPVISLLSTESVIRNVAAGTLLRRALERAGLCSFDPLCADREPDAATSALHGAACHACLLVAETSCERGNRYLDRSTLVGTFRHTGLAYFG